MYTRACLIILFITSAFMDWTIERHHSPSYFRVTLSGRFGLPEFRKLLDEIILDKEWKPGSAVLFDDRGLTISEMSEADLQSASDVFVKNSRLFLHGKIAVLVDTKSDFDTGIQFAANTQPIFPAMIEVFTNEQETLEWLADDTF